MLVPDVEDLAMTSPLASPSTTVGRGSPPQGAASGSGWKELANDKELYCSV
jgi:hypothetical protein